jgi:hypothetical protein
VQALCVARHPYIAEHIARFFGRFGLATEWTVGVDAAMAVAAHRPPALVLCEYDLLATQPLDRWECHPTLATVPVLAVSLTRRPTEVNLLDVNGIAGFLYLPTLRREDAARVLGVARPPDGYTLPSPFGTGARPAASPRGW